MLEINVQGMSCQHCVQAVTRAVHAIDPEARVDVDLASGQVTIGSSAARDAFVAAIDDAGYTVRD